MVSDQVPRIQPRLVTDQVRWPGTRLAIDSASSLLKPILQGFGHGEREGLGAFQGRDETLSRQALQDRTGAARALLRILDKAPDTALRVLT